MENASSSDEPPSRSAQSEFKMPILFGRIGKLPKKILNEPEKTPEENETEKSLQKTSTSNAKSSLPPAVLLKELSTPIPYKEPKWSGQCPEGSDYALDVLKSGMIVDKVDLSTKPYYVFGRLANCDVVMAHPTVSRHHAVIQYKAFADASDPTDAPSGLYLYDLDSTHGTFLNRCRLKAQHYTRVRVGHQIKFGASSRTYIVVGPDFDCEGESELTVTEIKQRAQNMKLERDRVIQETKEQRERDREDEERRKEEQGVDWGMGEDAEDEPDLADNPFAAVADEELFLQDPKKTLRGYFEREGAELEYRCDERGQGQFICRVELPLDDSRGRPLVAEVLHKGKKKEAVIACAMEACRMLDRAGLLRQAAHESRRRKKRDYSEDDYYSSDDDNYLDRTGAVERRRRKRMGAGDAPVTLTYDGLLAKIADLENKIEAEEKCLEALRARSKPVKQEEEDDLDAYMESIKTQGQTMAQKAEISSTKMSIQKLKAELTKTHRLADLARPAHLPPLIKKEDTAALKLVGNAMFGKRIKLKQDIVKPKPKAQVEKKQEDSEFVEEMDSDEESTQTEHESTKAEHESTELQHKSNKTEHESTETQHESMETEQSTETDKTKDDKSSEEKKVHKRVFGPMRPPENYVIPENYFDQESDRDLPEIIDENQ